MSTDNPDRCALCGYITGHLPECAYFRAIPTATVCPTCERPFGAPAPPTIEELAAAIWNADLTLGNTSSAVEGEDLWWHEAEAEDKWPGSRADTRKQAEVILAWLREPAPDFFARGGCPHTPKCDPEPCPEYTPPSPKWPTPEGGHG